MWIPGRATYNLFDLKEHLGIIHGVETIGVSNVELEALHKKLHGSEERI